MNRRQKLKKLKRDNKLMHDIINNSSEMKELYRAYNEPIKNVVHTTMRFQEYKAKRMIPVYMADVEGIVEHTKQAVAKDLFESIKENITYEVESEHRITAITASIFVNRN